LLIAASSQNQQNLHATCFCWGEEKWNIKIYMHTTYNAYLRMSRNEEGLIIDKFLTVSAKKEPRIFLFLGNF
jgi:hypothetical protein